MSLDKAIKSGKEKRNPNRPASFYCLNNGGCTHCRSNRTIYTQKNALKAQVSEQEYEDDRRHPSLGTTRSRNDNANEGGDEV